MDTRILVIGLIIGIIIGIGVGYAVFSSTPSRTVTITSTIPYTTTITRTTTTTMPTTITSTITKTQTITQTSTTTPSEYTIKLAYDPKIGFYLVDSKGMTLYFFAKDYDGTSKCYGDCAKKWPPFYTEKIIVSPGLNPDDFSVITREDGSKQIAYKGWPLYYFFKDEKPGDIKGDGVKGVWFVAKPDYTVMIAVRDDLGAYLVDDKGMTLYVFKKDELGKSNCYGDCAEKWPIFSPNKLIIPSTLNITDFYFIKRDDGTVQLTYKGWPLYYFFMDTNRGDVKGQGVKNVWYVASITGN